MQKYLSLKMRIRKLILHPCSSQMGTNNSWHAGCTTRSETRDKKKEKERDNNQYNQSKQVTKSINLMS